MSCVGILCTYAQQNTSWVAPCVNWKEDTNLHKCTKVKILCDHTFWQIHQQDICSLNFNYKYMCRLGCLHHLRIPCPLVTNMLCYTTTKFAQNIQLNILTHVCAYPHPTTTLHCCSRIMHGLVALAFLNACTENM